MNDFVVKPGDTAGLPPSETNIVEPGKRPLSSMNSLIVLKDNEPYLLLGGTGGTRIITSTIQVLINVLIFKMNLKDAINQPRIHHQLLPEYLYAEEEFNKEVIDQLMKSGFSTLKLSKTIGYVHGIQLLDNGNLLFAVDDIRIPCEPAAY